MKSKSTLFLKSLVMGLLLCLAAGQTNARSTLVRFNLHEAIGLTTPPTASATVAQPLGLLTPGDFGPLQVLAGGAYTLNFAAGDPAIYLPPISLPEDFGFPGADPVPTGRGDGDPFIANAYYAEPPAPNGTVVKVESLAPQDMALGQIVPFETQITVNGETASEDGTITFILGWNTLTTNSGDFGYDARPDDFGYGVIEAFIDTGDGAHNDPGGDALVSSFSWQLVNDEIVGVFTVAGLDDGDVVVLEAWLVLDDTIPVGIGGNVQSRLIDAATGGNLTYSVANSGAISLDDPDGNNGPLGDAISTGNQTVPLLKPSDFFNVQVDLSVTKTDDVDPIALGETLTYTVTVANAAGDNISVANSVVVYDELPADVTFVSASGGGFINTDPGDAIPDGAVQWNVGALAPGESIQYTVEVTVNEDAPTTGTQDLVNTVTVTTISDDIDESNNVATEPTDVQDGGVGNLFPVAANDSNSTTEDVAATGNVLTNDDPGDGPATVTSFDAVSAAGGTVSVAANGDYSYTPPTGFVGTDTFTYTITDANGDTSTATVTITVADEGAPVAVDDSETTTEDTPVTGDWDDNDALIDGAVLALQPGDATPSNGTVTVNADGSYTYTPNTGFAGTDSFTYTVCDDDSPAPTCDQATVTIAVNPVNDPPVAEDDAYTTDEDVTLTVAAPGILGNDSDPDGDELTLAVLTQPANGTLTQNADGSLSYEPNPDFNGTDSYTYEVCDPSGACDPATVTIAVNPVNDPPVAEDDAYTTDEDVTLTVAAPGILGNDSDPDGDELTLAVLTQPANGTLTQNADGSLTYEPNPDFNGTDSYTYEVCDPSGACDPATVTIAVNPVNDPPVAEDDAYTTDEDVTLTVAAPGILGNDSDPDGDELTLAVLTQPANGTLTQNADGSLSYEPNPDFNGTDSYTYEVCDPSGACDPATVTIAVNPVNDPPVAEDDAYTTDEDVTLTVAAPGILGNDSDPDGDELTLAVLTQPANGTLTQNADGSLSYEPNPDFNGTDSYTYEVCDPSGACDPATVTIAVNPVNDPPVAEDDAYTTDEDVTLTVAAPGILGNDSDPDGDELTLAVLTQPANGTLTQNADGSLSYEPNPDFNGTDSYTYEVCDPSGACDPATVTIAVNPVNDPPVAEDDAYTTDEDVTLTVAAPGILGNDSDPDGDELTLAVLTQPANGTLTQNADGSLSYEPNPDFNGTDSYTYEVCDPSGACDPATVTIAVNPVNDPPVAEDDAYTTDEDVTLTVAAPGILGNDSDPDGDELTLAVLTQPANGTLTQNADGSLSYEPNPDFNGTDSYTYEVCDPSGACDPATVTITVNPVNDFPNASNDSYTVLENSGTTTLTPSATDNDDFGGDGPSTGTIAIATSPTNGTVTVNNNGTPNDPTDDTFDYTPNADFNGSDSFTYTITDSNGDESTATVQITVEPVAISIIKTGTFNDEDGDNFADVGETITYSFTVANEGNAILTDVTVTDPKVAVLGGPTTLDIGEIDETTFSGSYTLTQADINAGGVNNQALATGTDPNGNDVTDLSDDNSTLEDEETVTPLPQNPSISIIKSGTFNDESGDGFANVGETISYMFTVTNNGNVTLTNVTVDDDMVFVFCGAGASNSIGTMAPGDVVDVCIASYTLTQADIDAGSVSNQATATGTDPNNQPVSDDSDSTNPADDTGGDDDPTVTPVLQNPAISIIKTATFNDENGDGFADVGETITYSFTVANEGNVTLSNVSVSDPLLTVDGGPLASLAVGATDATTFSGSYALTQDDIDNGSVSNQATATGDDPNGGPVSDVSDDNSPTEDDSTITPTPQNPAISIIKSATFNDENGDGFADVGETITYSFTVANEGNVTLSNVSVSDPLLTVDGGPLASLAVGASDATTFSGSYALTQDDIDNGSVSNQATATGDDPNGGPVSDVSDDNSPTEDDSTITPTPQNPAISIIKSATFNDENGDGFADVGETITYSFTVANEGNVTLSDVTVSDPLLTVDGGPLASLAVGATDATTFSGSYALTQDDIDNGSVSNQATATGDDPNGGPVSDVSDDNSPTEDDSTITPTPQNPAISIIKTATFNDENMDGFADVGETITYSFTVANEGNVTLSNVSVSDPLLTVDGGPLASLAVGATDATTFSGSYALTQDDIDNGSVSNQATATGDDPNGAPVSDVSDDNSPTEDDSTITPTPQNPAISIIKTATFNDENMDGFADVGETITYSFTVANEGNVTLSNVSVSDPLLTVDGGPLASLAVGATDATTFSGSYALTQDDIDNGSVSNQATATGDDPNGAPVSDVSDDNSPTEDDSTITPTPQNPAISIIKTATFNDENMDGFADVGETITYSFTVANEGNVTLSNVSVSDPLLTVDGGPLASLAVGASDATTFSGSYALTQDDIDNGSVSNQATATGDDPNGAPVSDVSDDNSPTEDDSTITPTPQNPAISIIKSATFNDENMDGFADVGETITYSFTVANEGNVTLSDVTVSDQLITVNGGPLATLAVGATDATTFSGSYTITQADIDAGEFANQATATGDDPNGDPVSDDSDDNSPLEDDPTVTDLPQNPAISIIKFATFNDENMDGFADVDETITYNFTVANEGNVTLSDVTVSDQLITVNGGPLATLAVGATDATTFSGSYTITQADIDAGEFANQATATGDDPNGDPVSDDSDDNSPLEDDPTVTPLPQNPVISMVKTFAADAVIAGGAGSSFTLVVTNAGNVTLSDVLIEDLVDSRLEVTSVSGTAGSDADSDGDIQTVEWHIGSLAPGASQTITVNFTVDASVAEANGVGGLNDADEVPNVATVGAEAPQGDPGDPGDDITDVATDVIDILVDIDLSIVKTFDPTEVPQGTSQSFTIEVSNAGPSDAVDVSVTDMVNSSLEVTGVSHDAATGDCSASAGQDVNCTVNVPVGETVTVTVDYVTAPFLNDGSSPYGTGIGDDFYFVFLNGSILEGSTDGGPVYLDGVEITDDVSIVTSLSRNDIVFDPPGPDPAFELHLSCSDPFTDGWGQSGGPVEGVDVNWQIAFFTVARYSPQGFLKSCGNLVNDFEVLNTAQSFGDDSYGTQEVFDNATVTVGPGITIDRLATKGKRLTARLTNWTGEDKVIESIEVMWPESNGDLKKVWLTYGNTSDVIWQGSDDPAAAIIAVGDPGWNGATLFTGEAILRFDFQNKVADCPYTIQVFFTDGTWLDIQVSEAECGGAALAQPDDAYQVAIPEQEAALGPDVEIRAFPNPSAADVNIIFSLDRDEDVRLDIYNTLGMRVATLFDGKVRANEQHTVVLRKDQVAYGTYFYRLTTREGSQQGQILILQ